MVQRHVVRARSKRVLCEGLYWVWVVCRGQAGARRLAVWVSDLKRVHSNAKGSARPRETGGRRGRTEKGGCGCKDGKIASNIFRSLSAEDTRTTARPRKAADGRWQLRRWQTADSSNEPRQWMVTRQNQPDSAGPSLQKN